ncbi:Multifunctional cyclase-dehydratase-3-O-methyl transferase TcmN (plasmid) [Streptomyces sp. YIM 121038]|uniref:methyltransferase n=1 Tax=Streptomyces sp. YIM 121038 TaxID=2136401 RepID=UPI0011108312|nr:methyltransferase [Streptomyces sp. YIM 121038]QCX82926.1 Multifunctional cyclase-dehydratase-3-O-methyl transferase TcmN [Streptomyces sp. YIM 121038]
MKDSDLLRLIIHGTTAFELLHAGIETDLFARLEEAGGLDIAGVAKALNIEEQPARVLLLGLAALQLIKKEGNKYVNSEIVRSKLIPGPRYLGPLIDLHARIINPAMTDFTQSLKENKNVGLRTVPGPGATLYERLTNHPHLQQCFYRNMGNASARTLPTFLDTADLADFTHLLDLGGGDATTAIAAARHHPHLELTVFDQGSSLHLAAANIQEAGLEQRIHTYAGDIFSADFPCGIDGILYIHLFEVWSLQRNIELLTKCYEVLPEQGSVFIYNFASNNDNTGPLTAGLVSPYFLTLASGEGMNYSARDVTAVLKAAGFQHVETHDDLPYGHTLHVGTK